MGGMNKHYEYIHRYDFLTKELLEEDYVTNGLSDQQIADKYHMPSKTVVWRKRKKFGIENKYAAKSNKHANSNRKFTIGKKTAEKMLADDMSFSQIATAIGCSLVVAKRRFKELGLCKTQHHTQKYQYWDVELTESQKQMIIGSTLGDGTIPKHGAYSCSHSSKQFDYLKHKMDVLASIHSDKIQHAVHKACGADGKPYESDHFTTGCNKFCKDLYSTYYPQRKKIFPYDFLIKHMSVEALAYWYMDDGGYKSKSTSVLCTYGFTVLEQLLIQNLLGAKFNLLSQIKYRKARDDYYQHFTTTETPKLFNLIEPHMIESMKYKIEHKEK